MAAERIGKRLFSSLNLAIKATRLPCGYCLRRHYAASRPAGDAIMNVFDRKTKRHQRNIAARRTDHNVYDYLKDEVNKSLCLNCFARQVIMLKIV